MLLTYEDALYYKLLSQVGYEKDVDDWITFICNSNETLEYVNLDLAFCQGKNNEIISCLHNYIGDNKVDEIIVHNRLRLFILEKLNRNEVTIEQAADSLSNFALATNNWFSDIWFDFYVIGEYLDEVNEGIMKKEDFYLEVRKFIETGDNMFYNTRPTNNASVKKQKNKSELYFTLVLLLILIILIICISLR